MRNFILYIYFLFFGYVATAQNTICPDPDNMGPKLRTLSQWVGLNYQLSQIPAQDYQFVIPDDSLSNVILNEMLNVHYQAKQEYRDTLFRFLKFHTEGHINWPFTTLIVSADPDISWVQDLIANGKPVQDDYMKIYAKKYGFTRFAVDTGFSKATVFIESDSVYNPYAAKSDLLSMPGVEDVILFPSSHYVYSYNIWYSADSIGSGLTYDYGWMDCRAGCVFHRKWEFRTVMPCSTEFLNVTGHTIDHTEWQRILNQHHPVPEQEIVLYPNPARDLLNLRGMVQQSFFSVYSLCGEHIIQGETKGEIGISHLKPGVYILGIQIGNAVQHLRFIKE